MAKKTIIRKPQPETLKLKKQEEITPSPWYAKSTLWLKIALFVFAFILYGNTMKNGYSLDDLYVTYNNPVVKKGIKAIPLILSSRYINVNAEEGGMMNFGYRPLTKVMFAVEHQLFGESPGVSHLVNILLYALTLLVLFSILRKLLFTYSIWFPFLVTMLWAAHPVHTEVVASLKNREEIMSLLFALLSLLCYMRFVSKNSYVSLAGGAILFLMSFFTKTSTIPLLAAIPFTIYFFTKADTKKLLFIIGSLMLVVISAVIFLRLTLPPGNRPMLYFENPLAFQKNLLLHISTGMYCLLMYLKLLVYPHPLLFYYGYNVIPMVGLANPWVILSLAIHLALFVYALLKLREKHILSFAILFYLTMISMYSNIIKPPAGIIAERFLYIASLGFSIAVIYLIFRLFRIAADKPVSSKQISKIILVVLVILVPYTARTVVRNRDWNSQLSLFSHDMEYLSNSAKANYIYASTLRTQLIEKLNNDKNADGTGPQVEKIIGLLEQTVKVYPGYFEAWNSLGEMYAMMKNDNDKALEYFTRTVKEKPTFAAGWYNLGYTNFQKQDFPNALNDFRKAASLDSNDLKTLSNLATCYHKTGQLDSAVYTNEKIIRHKPDIVLPYINNASFYLAHQDSVNAVIWLEKAAKLKPDNAKVTGVLARYFARKGDTLKAEHYRQLNEQAKAKQEAAP
ncbi:MAG: tetratricopeptide repeat protein [Bacteroidota bacterium]